MKVLFVISGSETAFWLSEVTHPYWHLTERGVEVEFASPAGGKVVYDPYSDPYFEHTTEPEDLVSKGFLSDKTLVAKLDSALKLADVDLDHYDAIHVAGGRGATFDLYPNADVAHALEHFWAKGKVVGAICHGAIALGNIPTRIRGRRIDLMLFHVGIDVNVPLDFDRAKLEELGKREHERAAELQRQGKWLHLWRIAGQWANISIFRVDSPLELHEILESLPLHPFMNVEVTALCRHPGSLKDEESSA